MKKNIINTYQIFVRKLYNQGLVKINNKLLDFFIEEFQEVIDENFIWDYISFQMEYWSGIKTNFTLKPDWVFGQKAISRWKKKQSSWSFYTQQFLNKVEIQRPVEYFKANLKDNFQEIRGRNFGTEQGFADCLSFSFYLETSEYCKVCIFKDVCKTI